MTRAERRRIQRVIDSGGEIRLQSHEFDAAMSALTDAGRFVHVTILHDDDCTPSRCVCRPDYVLAVATPERLVDGARAQRQWIRETTS